ncbi:MAG: Adenylyl cyclase CyaB [Microgenomates group bacterium GW2011_GWA1_Microgenomates_45_10]|nr:MAG: Adenylyl cyclase CyaB [Microgenomates group bacterium GW2011_GWA1_Microgenomates_45_10]
MMDLRNAQMKNIESKFAVKGLDDIRLALKKDARFVGVLNQVDTYFNVMHGRLKIRQEGKKSEIIRYNRPDTKEVRISEYQHIRLPGKDVRLISGLLKKIFGMTVCVKKKRELWIKDQTRIHLDKVKGLGSFVELETVLSGISFSQGTKQHGIILKMLNPSSNQ